MVWGRLKRVDDFIVKEMSEREGKRASRCMCFAAIGTDIFPRYPQGSTCPCDTGYFWALVTDGVAIHPKHAEDGAEREKKREKEREIKRKAERGEEEIYIHVSAARGRITHIGISIYQSERQIDSSIH